MIEQVCWLIFLIVIAWAFIYSTADRGDQVGWEESRMYWLKRSHRENDAKQFWDQDPNL